MMVLLTLVIYTIGVICGGLLYKTLYKYTEKSNKDKLINKINNQFKQILSNVSQGNSVFKNRVNNTVFIGSRLEEHGDVDVIYMMDNKDIAIFKENKCIYTSTAIENNTSSKQVLVDLANTIEKRFKTQINDVVDILGFKFYREEFEKSFNINMNDLKKQLGMEESDLDKIQSENNAKFDIDEILDKINKNGMNSLTFEERVFLDNYSKNS